MLKEQIFNYFIEQVARKAQEVLQLSSVQVARLSIVFAKFRTYHQNVSGGSMETAYYCETKYAIDLFLFLCLNTKELQDNLLKEVFDFQLGEDFINGGTEMLKVLRDADLTKHLNETIYPCAYAVDKQLYQELIPEDFDRMFSRIPKTWFCNVTKELPVPEFPNKYTEMIDRALQRAYQTPKFIDMLKPEKKYVRPGLSVAYLGYVEMLDDVRMS